MKKKRFAVSIPITGHLYYEVEAGSKNEASELAWGMYEDGDHGDVHWEAVDEIVTGNCFHGLQNSISVDEIKDRDDKRSR